MCCIARRHYDCTLNPSMFVFFSNRLGCMGSLLVSAVGTVAVILLIRACNAGF